MPKLTLAVRIAAGSLLLLSLADIIFWTILAVSLRSNLSGELSYNYLFLAFCIFAASGLSGIFISAGLFRASNWARIGVLVLAALVALFCAFGMLVLLVLIFGFLPVGGPEIELHAMDLVRLFAVYLFFFLLAIWWIVLFARKPVAAQFSAGSSLSSATPNKPNCPPPIALLAWLMILSSALSALSWPLVLGKIPAMLFTHVFSAQTSKWIWVLNILLFLVCGIGLLKLQRWSYTGAIALHAFWLVSLLFTQLSPDYDQYMNTCLNALELRQTYPGLSDLHFPQWLSALATAVPTALLVAGLFYYRPAFLEAVQDSHHPPS